MIAVEEPENELDLQYTLSQDQIEFYSANGYIKLPHVLSPGLLRRYQKEIASHVEKLSAQRLPLHQRNTYDKAFLQVGNLWTLSLEIRQFVFGKRLARIAAELMGCDGVRMYHDQALYKEAGGGITPWHADQYYWPVSTDNVITAWIPLQDTPLEMGPLAFCEKSHRFQTGRELEISDESELALKQALHRFRQEESPFAMGEVSFHAGWTFHRAGGNTTNRAREVMTVIYMDEDIRLATPRNKNQVLDKERWCPGVEEGEVIASPLNPIIYTTTQGPA